MTLIATVGADIPRDLLNATGRSAGPLGWRIDRPTPAADAWLESKFPPWARSILQDWADGQFDHLGEVIFSRSDDCSHRLYYYVCELRRRGLLGGPEPIVFDVARLPRASSRGHMVAQVRNLAERLGVRDNDLEEGIARTNAHRRSLSAEKSKISPGPVCLLAGTAPPDRRLHEAIEKVGWEASGPTLADLWQDPGLIVREGTGQPAEAIAEQLHAAHVGPRGQYDPAAQVAERAARTGASAAILWYTEEEEALVWHLPAQRRAIEKAGLPLLTLTRRDWTGCDGVDRDIVNFLKELKV